MAIRPEIDVVICTYNRAASLDAALNNLARQVSSRSVVWRVVVIDNASTDHTAEVVEAHRAKGSLPGLRRVFEPTQGLTVARLRGVQETAAPWIAFVDDDNFPTPTWLEAVGRAIDEHPDAGGIGGKVVLDWEVPSPSYLKEFAFCFAAQDHGDADCLVKSLAGAGMVLRRSALAESGWLDRPLVADRVGKSLISGGDVEMAQRVHSAGYGLWFVPHAVLMHRIPAHRMSRQYLFRINAQLGASSALIGLLTWSGDWDSWCDMAQAQRKHWYGSALRGLRHALRHHAGLTPAIAWACFAIGFARGVRKCNASEPARRRDLLGAAALPRT